MSILVRGMEMPECCGYCPFEYKKYCMAKPSLAVESADRHPRCPLVPVPPHRRLIDADALYEMCVIDTSADIMASTKRINEYMQLKIDDAPTVIGVKEGE